MDATTRPQTPKTDAVELVRQLDAGAIRARLDEIENERQALLVLLRAALRRRSRTTAARAR
ncbi:unnamed protein product [Gemmataceae bacterium]|nr:unnamed protein product [Gemmataceae bacterium]VTU02452.1 unnamed protein product [Gemmataceae bacterium]